MKHAVFMGIDPGVSGGLACIGPEGPNGHVVAIKMPGDDHGILHWLKGHKAGLGGQTFVVIERVGGYVAQNGPHPGSRMFTFGCNFGSCRMASAAIGVQPLLISPQVWQRTLGTTSRRKGEDKHRHKARLRDFAQNLFPSVKVTLNTSDSLLLAEYCRRYVLGLLKKGRGEGGNGKVARRVVREKAKKKSVV